jgi:3-deoxy-7-phosphoheptulonate synthase
MHSPTFDLRIRAQKPLIAPAVLEDELPLSDPGATLVADSRRDVAAVLSGKDDRLLVVVGPCSVHDIDAAYAYAQRLREVTPLYARDLVLVMRVYFEKPRTVMGWKGLINDPFLDDTFQINMGLRFARRLMLNIINLGLPVATEFLDTTLGQYYADLVSWGAIGARTVESQVHRELASGLSMPVGFKNRTDGEIQVAVDAIRASRHPHWFPSLTREGAPAIMGTAGNEHGHLVLRGGSHAPNYSAEHVRAATELLRASSLPPHLMIDLSHGNSSKDPARQPLVAADVAGQIAGGERAIAAVMIESNLVGGTQPYHTRPLVYGRSITDACLSWEETLPVLATLAEAVRRRRG